MSIDPTKYGRLHGELLPHYFREGRYVIPWLGNVPLIEPIRRCVCGEPEFSMWHNRTPKAAR